MAGVCKAQYFNSVPLHLQRPLEQIFCMLILPT